MAIALLKPALTLSALTVIALDGSRGCVPPEWQETSGPVVVEPSATAMLTAQELRDLLESEAGRAANVFLIAVDQDPLGSVGPAGEIGPQGPIGPAGADGATGPQGAAGTVGAMGPQGATGADGAAGPQGPPGADGASGPQGLAGPQGPPGADGATGPEGPPGPQGAVGPQGPPGADGATGPQGAAGPQGPPGADGATGATGAQGATGPPGIGGIVIAAAPQSAQAWTNMPAATTELFGNVWGRRQADLTSATKFRISVAQSVAGTAAAALRAQYSLDGGTNWNNLESVGTAADLVVGAGTGTKTGSWGDLAVAAQADVLLRLVGYSGDGVADPAFRFIAIYVK